MQLLANGSEQSAEHVAAMYRHCTCGGELSDYFTDRRDYSDQGQVRRDFFGTLVAKLEMQGLEPASARDELLKVMRGEGRLCWKRWACTLPTTEQASPPSV